METNRCLIFAMPWINNPSGKSKKRYNGRLWEINWWCLPTSLMACIGGHPDGLSRYFHGFATCGQCLNSMPQHIFFSAIFAFTAASRTDVSVAGLAISVNPGNTVHRRVDSDVSGAMFSRYLPTIGFPAALQARLNALVNFRAA